MAKKTKAMLEEEIKVLKKHNDELNDRIESMMIYNNDLENAILALKAENDSLSIENSHLVENGFIDQAIDAAVEFTDQKRIIPPVQFITEGTYVHKRRMYGWTKDMM